MPTAVPGLAGNPGIDTAQQLKPENFGGLRVVWKRNSGALHELNTSSHLLIAQGKKLPAMKKKIPDAKTGLPPRWAERIIAARKKLGMNQTDFAGALDVTQSNVSKWERGEYRPSPDVLVKIAGMVSGTDKFFFWEEAGLPSEYFMGTAEKSMPSEIVRATKTIIAESFAPVNDRGNKTADAALVPLLSGSAAAGNPRAIDGRDVEKYLTFPREMLPKAGTIVAVRVKGESMAPLVNDSDVVLIDLTDRNPKDLVGRMVVAHNGEGVTVKFLRKDHDDYLLVPYNVSLRHEVMILRPKEGWGIVGAVVLWIGRPRAPKH
jgi:SOS-response transcriptional repressor LexA